MRKIVSISVCAFLCAALLLTGCDNEKTSDTPSELIVSQATSEAVSDSIFPVTVCGAELDAATERAVSLSPAITEIIAELGFSDRLVGKSIYCDYPESSVSSVGSAENPDIEKIIESKPDTLFTLTELSERDLYKLSSSGITVLTLSSPISLEDYAELYENIAAAFYGAETDENGSVKAKRIGEQALDELESAVSGTDLGNFVYVTEKLTIAGSGTFENAVLSLCGKNLSESAGYSAPSTVTTVPDVIVTDSAIDETTLRADEAIAAMLDGGAKVVHINASRFERPSSRIADIFSP